MKRSLLIKITFMAATAAFLASQALASGSLPDQCIYALNRSAPGSLTLSGPVNLNLSGCGIVVDSSSDSALAASGSASVNAKYIDIVGAYTGAGQVAFSTAPQTGSAYSPDPLSFLSPPTSKKCDFTNLNISSGSSRLTPGTYCNGISISGNADITLAPGTYILMGGGLHASGTSRLTGQGTIVLTQGLGYSYGPVLVSGSAVVNLQALKSGDYPGILFYQDGRLGAGLPASAISGSRNSKLEGVLYFPTTGLTWSGSATGAEGAYLAIVADTINITGSATIGTNYGSLRPWLELGSVVMGLQSGAAAQSARPTARVLDRLDNGKNFVLTANTHPLIASSTDQGEVDGSVMFPRIAIHFKMTDAQQADLQQLLKAQQDKSSSLYHKWLTPEQFAARFGASEADVNQVSAWLQGMGFTDVTVARGRTFISMTGTAAQVKYAFQAPVHRYVLNGETHHAISVDPTLPQALQGIVSGIRGLNDFHPHARARRVIQPKFTSSISGNHFMAPGDFYTIYGVAQLLANGITGTGQSIAIAGQTDIQVSDIEAFQTASGLTVNDPQIVLDGTDPGTSTDDLSEADLDIEWSGAIAPGATIIYVNSSDAFTSVVYAIDNNLAPIVSVSYGACEAQVGSTSLASLNTMFQQASAQGITIVGPAGDQGAADCDSTTGQTTARHGLAVDFPASSPYVTGAGGSEFNEGTGTYWNTTNNANSGSATSYIPEMAWNDTALGAGLAAGGGGASGVFPKPSWQLGTGVPSDGARDVPDIALNASPNHDGYLICTGGSCVNGYRDANSNLQVFGGTSCAVPTFAAIVALIDQSTNSHQGNVNPTMYALASGTSSVFHDITVGNNQVPCVVGTANCTTGTLGYVAGTGYDQVTGLGSINAYNLVTNWNSGFTITLNPTSLTLAPGGSGTATLQATAVGEFAGNVQFSCSVPSTLTHTTCSIPGTVTGSGTATLMITNTSSTASVPLFPTGGIPYLPAAGLLAAMAGIFLVTRKRLRLASMGVLVMAALMTGCGSGNSSSTTSETVAPTPMTGIVTVTATSGIVTQTATVTVTVS